MRSRSVGRVRTGLLVSMVAACLVLSGAWAEAARAKEAKGPAARRDRKGGRRKGGQAAGRKKSGQGADAGKKGGPRGVIQLARLNARALKTLYGKLDADSSGSVSLDEFKALPKVLQKMAKDAAEKAKARRGKKSADGATDPPKKGRSGRRKKKRANSQ